MNWWQDPDHPLVILAEADRAYARRLINFARRYYPNHPEWYVMALIGGAKHPCPICQGTGKIFHRLALEYPGAVFPRLKCFHCQGTSDEDAAIRRNLQGRRPLQ